MRHALLTLLLAFVLAPVPTVDAQASNKIVGKPCLAKYKLIKAKGKHWTAFAANQANRAGQACGWAREFPARETAVSGALSECRASERDHPTWGKHGSCKIIFVQ
jgi:hypothetical protein